MADPEATGGEAGAELTETTASASEGQANGQSGAPDQTTGNGSDKGGESFFDYETIRGKPELEAAYREMQGSYTKKNEVFAQGRDKISQYDNFMKNPVDTMRQLAQQYGYQMIHGQAEAAADGKPKSYENWDEVDAAADKRADKRLEARLGPMVSELQTLKKQNVTQALDKDFPDWRTYEDSMLENLQAHPTLVNDHEKLYQMSVPASVLEARATKAALAKIQGTTDSGKVQGQSTTTQQATAPKAAKSFEEAAANAHALLASQGMKPPRE